METIFPGRKEAIASYIELFCKTKQIEVNINEAAEKIVAVYGRYTDEVVRPSLEPKTNENGVTEPTKIQNYKIIANTELAVLRVEPIELEDDKIAKRLNAELAFHIGLGFLLEWHKLNPALIARILDEDEDLKKFLAEHFTWLILLDTRNAYPIFSNCQIWRLFHYVLMAKLQQTIF